jgi:cytochrome c peroxidase
MSRKVRRLAWMLGALALVAVGGFLGLGFLPVPPDVPSGGGESREPGNGGVHRPFPPMLVRPDNPVSPEKAALGRLLYFDPVLSGANDFSCASCHHPDLGFTDGRGLAMGKGGRGLGPERTGGTEIRRGAPTIWNAAFNHRQFWDGRAADLEDQARFPITSPDEMDEKPEVLVRELRAIPEYVALFDGAFAGKDGSAVTFDNVLRALATFERSIVSDRSAFDRYVAGETTALVPAERRGLTLFRSLKTRCFECHGFPTFANPDFKVIGVPDLPGRAPDRGRAETGAGPAYERAFKVPTLRNVARTAPYMHNGAFRTLDEVVDFYAKGGGRGAGLVLANQDDKIRAFTLTASEKADLIAFLGALTDESRRPDIPDRVPSGLPVVPRLAATPLPVPSPPAAPPAPGPDA